MLDLGALLLPLLTILEIAWIVTAALLGAVLARNPAKARTMGYFAVGVGAFLGSCIIFIVRGSEGATWSFVVFATFAIVPGIAHWVAVFVAKKRQVRA